MFIPEDWAEIFEAGEHAARTTVPSTPITEVLARVMQAMKDKANELAEYYEEDDDGPDHHQQSSARSALPGPGH